MHNLMSMPLQAGVPGLWQPAHLWPPERQPQEWWPWLIHAGSLTGKLRAAVGTAFHVKVLREGAVALSAEDALRLHTLPGAAAHRREVHLCGTSPLVFARTQALAPAATWLKDLNAQPLGDRVFAQAGAQRSMIEVAQLDAAQPMYRAAVAGIAHPPVRLWARRSVLTVRDSRLLIYECFLAVAQR